jgi:hypothetical protein
VRFPCAVRTRTVSEDSTSAPDTPTGAITGAPVKLTGAAAAGVVVGRGSTHDASPSLKYRDETGGLCGCGPARVVVDGFDEERSVALDKTADILGRYR